ncbi:MAG: leucine-rich repeat domain-containing protein [Oscillospiraceae bacterium]|nr:leucine-rich repeat domain-containing protein [Oscillospiraceae bacterium]
MKKTLFVLLALFLTLAITACGSPAATSSPDPSATTAPPDPTSVAAPKIVAFADPALEKMIRASIGKPSGDITSADAAAVTRLDFSGEWQGYLADAATIHDIGGLEAFTNLEHLDLSFHEVGDITPLAGLTKLTTLILSGNPITDIAPLSTLTSLKFLDLSGSEAPDYGAISSLTSLEYLKLTDTSLTDVTPLAGLSALKCLFLKGSPVENYFPLAELSEGLFEKDFIVATTLVEIGFYMDFERKQAILDGDGASVHLNHREWGNPPDDWMGNCIRVVFGQNDYKIDIGYYPEHDAYVVMAFKGDQALNYVYDRRNDPSILNMEDRASKEETVRAVFAGTDTDPEDVLLTPVRVYQDLLAQTAGLSVETLFEMPYDENDHSLPTPFTRLGFTFLDYKGTYYYEEQEPHELHLYVHRAEFDTNVSPENRLDWNMEFFEADVNGYSLELYYYEADDRYTATLEKDGEQTSVNIRSATYQPGDTSPDDDTARQAFNDAFGTEGDDFYVAAHKYFEQVIQNHFGMWAEELYGLKG